MGLSDVVAGARAVPQAATRIRPATGPSPFKSIVCGVDASRSGHEAVAQAIALAGPATVLSLVCIHWEAGQGLVQEATIGAERAERALREAVELAGEAGIDAAAGTRRNGSRGP